MFAEQLEDHLDELAHHYSRSDNVAKAVEYLGRAGQQAPQRSVLNVNHFCRSATVIFAGRRQVDV